MSVVTFAHQAHNLNQRHRGFSLAGRPKTSCLI